MRSTRAICAVTIAVIALICSTGCLEAPRTEVKRNVLIVLWDAARARNLSVYGYGRSTTPYLQEFAESSAVFTQARSQTSYTLPSVVTILTSALPEVHGAYWEKMKGKNDFVCYTPDAGSERYVQEILSSRDFWSVAIVGNRMLKNAKQLSDSFDTYRVLGGWKNTQAVTDLAISSIQKLKGSSWFLYVHYIDPHSPFDPPEPYRTEFFSPENGNEPIKGDVRAFNDGAKEWDERDINGHRDMYDGELSYLDAEFKRLMEALHASGVLDDTIVFVIADHGEAIGEHDDWLHGSVYEECIHIPMIVRFPNGQYAGEYDFLVETMDIGPTILRAQGLEIPEKFGGHPLQEQISREWQRTVSYSRYFSKSAFIFSDGYKLICYGNECRGGLEVFNLNTDPLELRNLANLKPDLAQRMRAEAFQWKSNHVVFDVETSALDGASLADDAEALRALGYLD